MLLSQGQGVFSLGLFLPVLKGPRTMRSMPKHSEFEFEPCRALAAAIHTDPDDTDGILRDISSVDTRREVRRYARAVVLGVRGLVGGLYLFIPLDLESHC
jgi:hypothetical protein